MRYFDTTTHTETHIESTTTILHDDVRVKDFFKPLVDGYRIIFINDLPVIGQVPLPTQAEIDAEANAKVYAELEALDKASIRDIREWIASQPNAPQSLKDREIQAITARAKIK